MNDDFDDLDRALFALPLEEPPADLRMAILRATSLHVAAPSVALRGWEIAVVGAVLAVAAWFLIVLGHDPRVGASLGALSATLADRAIEPSCLVWLAAGIGIATWFTLSSSGSLRLPSRAR